MHAAGGISSPSLSWVMPCLSWLLKTYCLPPSPTETHPLFLQVEWATLQNVLRWCDWAASEERGGALLSTLDSLTASPVPHRRPSSHQHSNALVEDWVFQLSTKSKIQRHLNSDNLTLFNVMEQQSCWSCCCLKRTRGACWFQPPDSFSLPFHSIWRSPCIYLLMSSCSSCLCSDSFYLLVGPSLHCQSLPIFKPWFKCYFPNEHI